MSVGSVTMVPYSFLLLAVCAFFFVSPEFCQYISLFKEQTCGSLLILFYAFLLYVINFCSYNLLGFQLLFY